MKRTKAVAVSHVSGAQNTPNCVCGRGSALDPAGRGRLTALFELPIAGFKGAAWRQGGEDRVESGGGKRGKEGEEGTEKKQERAGWSLLLHRSCVIETNLAVKWRNKTEFCPWQAHSSSAAAAYHTVPTVTYVVQHCWHHCVLCCLPVTLRSAGRRLCHSRDTCIVEWWHSTAYSFSVMIYGLFVPKIDYSFTGAKGLVCTVTFWQ